MFKINKMRRGKARGLTAKLVGGYRYEKDIRRE